MSIRVCLPPQILALLCPTAQIFILLSPAANATPFQHATLLYELTFTISGTNRLLYIAHVNFSETKVDHKKLIKYVILMTYSNGFDTTAVINIHT